LMPPGATPSQPGGRSSTVAPRTIAYMMSRFPQVTETFILDDIVGLRRLGLRVEVFPLLRERAAVMHEGVQAVADSAHYPRLLSLGALVAQLHWLRRRPGAYARAWARALAGNARSPKFLSRAVVSVPLAAQMALEMERLGVEHIHAHYATHPTLAAYVVRELTGIPYSFTAQAHDIYVERPMLAEKIRAASFVVAISDYNRRLLADLYGEEAARKTHVVRGGIDPELFGPRGAYESGDPFRIVCVASLQEYKGHRYLVEACARLAAEGIATRSLLVGEGEERSRLEAQIADLSLGDRIELLGAQPRHRVAEVLKFADAVALPSIVTRSGKKEGIPFALMESLAMEIPVVATDISGVPELVEDGVTGLLVPQRDPAALAAAIRRLVEDPELGRRLGAAGRERVLRDYNIHRNQTILLELLRRDWRASEAAR
jgi:colanic acid/amylovoran biosynthesis glycosyltransferase